MNRLKSVILLATLIQLAISRAREFFADERGAGLKRNPLALARALRKIEDWSRAVPMTSGSSAMASHWGPVRRLA